MRTYSVFKPDYFRILYEVIFLALILYIWAFFIPKLQLNSFIEESKGSHLDLSSWYEETVRLVQTSKTFTIFLGWLLFAPLVAIKIVHFVINCVNALFLEVDFGEELPNHRHLKWIL